MAGAIFVIALLLARFHVDRLLVKASPAAAGSGRPDLFAGLGAPVANNSTDPATEAMSQVVLGYELTSRRILESQANKSPSGPDTWGGGE
jgi:hypothetical protein